MKFSTNTNKPFYLDGISKFEIIFEIGDVFIDANNEVKYIKDIIENKVEFVDKENNHSFETFPLKEFLLQYKYAGTIEDDELPIYKDAVSLTDENE